MKTKLTLLALAVVSAAMFALPAVASAGEWSIEPVTGFELSSPEPRLTTTNANAPVVTCETVTGKGKYTSATTGEVELTAHGCHVVVLGFTIACTTSGQPSGTITSTTLIFHNVVIDVSPRITGILITSGAGGHFASFACGGQSIVISGNGIIGQIASPPCGTKTKTATLKFESTSPGHQLYKQVTTTGTIYDLTSSTNGLEAHTAAEDAVDTIIFEKEVSHKC